jgi:hypothetical protein
MSNEIKTARKLLSAYDNIENHCTLDEMEYTFETLLRDIDIELDFTRSAGLWQGITSKVHKEYSSDYYDVLVQHPWFEIQNADQGVIYAYMIAKASNGVEIRCSVYLYCNLPKDVKDILWRIGKIEMQQPIAAKPYPSLMCY